MEYYYQWPISKESTPMLEHKKWDDSFWGKSARCMRRRGLCLPPLNYFPRGHRPQQNSTPFRSYDHSWKRLVPENPQPYCGMDFERTNKPHPAPSHKKRPCHNRGNKKTFKPCDNGYFPGASPQHIPGPYCGGPSVINDVYFNAFDYQHHLVERGHDLPYDPYLDCSNGFGGFCETSAPMESLENNRVKNPIRSVNNCDDLLSTAVKVAIEDPLPEQVDFLAPSVDLGEGILELPKDEAVAAAQTLEQLFPSLRFSSTEETHEFLNPVENSTTAQEEPRKEGELEQEAGLSLPPTLLSSSVEKPVERQEKIGGTLEDSKPLTDGSIPQDSVQFLANQNQFLSDVLSQFMSGGFDMNQRFLENYQTAEEAQNGNSEKPHNPSPSPSSGNIIQRENNTQEIRPFNDLGTSENVQCKDESNKTMEPSNIESEMNCNSSSIDWDYIFGKNSLTECKETTQSTRNTQELSSAFAKPISVFETHEEEFLRCVNPNAILKDKRPRKKVKRVITNVEVKTKRVRQNHKKGNEEETVQSMCKTDVYTSTEESDVHHELLLDAQTQVEEQAVLRVDAETQWYDIDFEGGTTSRNPLENLPELDEFDVNFNNCVLEPFPMPTLENQNIPKEGNGVDNSKTDTHVNESLFRSLVASVINSNTAGKENKGFESEIDRKIHVEATKSVTDSKRNSTEGSTTKIVADFLSDVLNCVPIKPSENNLTKLQASRPDMQHSDSFEVAAYDEVCSGESFSHVSSLPVAMETGVTKSVPGGLGCGEPSEMYSSKTKESNLQSLETMQESEVETLDEQEYITQTEGIDKDASNLKFPENEKDYENWESDKLGTINQGTPRFDVSEMQSEETVIVKGPSVLGETERVDRTEFEIKNTPPEKLTCKNDGSLSECKVGMEVPFQCNPIPQSSSNKNRPGRPRKKRALKETNRKYRKAVKSSKTPLPQEILVIPQVNATVQKRTLDSVSDQPPLKKRRLASLRCRPEFQKMM